MYLQSGVDQLIQDTDGLERMAAGVQGSSSKARITCLEVGNPAFIPHYRSRSSGVDVVVLMLVIARTLNIGSLVMVLFCCSYCS